MRADVRPMRERHEKPFAIIEQREVERIRALGGTHAHIATLTVLRVRADPDGDVRDGIYSLARWACMSRWMMQRSLRWLVERHVVAMHERERARDSGQGAAWRYRRRVNPFEFWNAGLEPEQEALPLWRIEGRTPTYGELVRFKAAGGQV